MKSDAGSSRWYPRYVLSVLIIVYILNFVDRQILSVLAEEIKADLQISDSDLGFLFGAAFAVFYAVLGLPLAKLADAWNRKKLISIGLTFWSFMTALSGLSCGFLSLAACRFGVGAGEASASPAAYSLLYDWFPPRVRTTVLAFYSTGVFIGQGIGMVLGGAILSAWISTYPDPHLAPFSFKGWQAAFMAVGLPGLVVAIWVATLREPERGCLDGLRPTANPQPIRGAVGLLVSMIPPTSFWALASLGGRNALFINLSMAAILITLSYLLIEITGDVVQWASLGVGFYAVACWVQKIAISDPVCFELIFGSRALMLSVAGAGATYFLFYGFGFWQIPYYQRTFGLGPDEVGALVGAATAVMGLLGVLTGGFVADRLRRRFRAGKLVVVMLSLVCSIACAALLLLAPTVRVAYAGTLGLLFFSAVNLGPLAATFNDLVLPRMRATSSAFGFMVIYMIAGAVGPYLVGKISDILTVTTGSTGEGLRYAMLISLIVPAIGIIFVTLAIFHIERDETSIHERALALGEVL